MATLPAELLTKTEELTPRQQKFLEVLFEEAQGDPTRAKVIAGYSPTTNTRDLLVALKTQITELTELYMATHTPEAMFKILNVMRDPSQPGAKTALQAAESVLDRGGVVKNAPEKNKAAVQNIFILPEKSSVTIDSGNVIDGDIVDVEDI